MFFPDDGLTESYSGPEVPLWEVSPERYPETRLCLPTQFHLGKKSAFR
jgi:hypothetical protein